MLRESITNRCLYEKSKIAQRHKKKLNKNSSAAIDQAKKHWVVNASQQNLNCDEIALLRKGMNFAFTPKSVPIKEIITAVEQGIRDLPPDKRNDIRERVSSTVKHAKCPKIRNISRQEEKVLKDLRTNKTILITKADKGNAVVVLNRVDYEKKIESMLSDETVYRHITDKRRNPTSKTELELQNRLLKLKKAGHLSDAEYKKIRPSDSYPAAFYGLPKVHKVSLIEQSDHYTIDADTAIPLRPINSSIGSPTYELSKYLTRILKCLYDEEYTVKNSKDFVDFVSTKKGTAK